MKGIIIFSSVPSYRVNFFLFFFKDREVWMHFLPNLQANFQREIVQIRSKMWYIHTILTKMCTKYVGF